MDRRAATLAVEQFLMALGHQPEGELAETAELVAEAWCSDLLEGQSMDARALLADGALMAEHGGGLVVVRDLFVSTVCPHHLLPAHGSADVIYLPDERVAGLGAVARALRAVSRKLTLQERAGHDMVVALMAALGARAAACRLRMTHTCLVLRGERAHGATVETLALGGSFENEDRALLTAVL